MQTDNPIRVAIADDQLLFRECLTSNLKNFDNIKVVAEVGTGRELIEWVTSPNPSPDVVLMDLMMPEMNGLEATRRLRKCLPDVKIVILSVHGDEKYVAHMVKHGINGYMAKNTTLEELYKAITTVHQTGFYFNEMVIRVLHSGQLDRKGRATPFEMTLNLTRREIEILELICREYTTPEIAEKLFLSVRTVDGYRNSLLVKTAAKNTAGLVVFAFKNRLVNVLDV
ncbi:MAG: response regulator transcription factor [Bacteroidetes bacterium]|nr:response regulator transcription factor [Bacteroidota bacterium]